MRGDLLIDEQLSNEVHEKSFVRHLIVHELSQQGIFNKDLTKI